MMFIRHLLTIVILILINIFEEKGNYWTSGCKENEKCIDEIVKKQKKILY